MIQNNKFKFIFIIRVAKILSTIIVSGNKFSLYKKFSNRLFLNL